MKVTDDSGIVVQSALSFLSGRNGVPMCTARGEELVLEVRTRLGRPTGGSRTRKGAISLGHREGGSPCLRGSVGA